MPIFRFHAKITSLEESRRSRFARVVELEFMDDPAIPAGQQVSRGAPRGLVSLAIDTPAALAELELGREFTVTIEPVR